MACPRAQTPSDRIKIHYVPLPKVLRRMVKRMFHLNYDLVDCREDFLRVLDIEREREISGRDSQLSRGIHRLNEALQQAQYVLIQVDHRWNNWYNFHINAAKDVRSIIHLTEAILDESTRLLELLEKRKVKRFMVAAGGALRSNQSENQILRSVDNIWDMTNRLFRLDSNFARPYLLYMEARMPRQAL
ncbi:hypothetical protein LTR10_023008 [Elasticomyces elasticus]|uniref:Uncharacterized protein n=1 Tax=Exophiala sideris TaxID=1016849 RepID=A0ABR0JLF3_9EURO|nr:hypothetical protein LTR10_023008 [Elasticomyces elasticus]KAK5036437.1 hypothetical protein LTS07_002164 [Exophiala sideris]KAK5041733.1 hypothetical protein LTR13_002400 [Exophiala sideris]KAK5066820.1 hypothetical protein LTR69_002168 [Exophiala sideris]KAK5184879.1 hypothetical protein LTR44_002725 [Eurotiomycetes sp. CCFEE 6388]